MVETLAALERRAFVLGIPAAIGTALWSPAIAARARAGEARYSIALVGLRPLRIAVRADLPLEGDRLAMSDSFPAELPEMLANGWPALIRNLEVTAPDGGPVDVTRDANGWRLANPLHGRVACSYTVDFGIFQSAGWSSPLESGVMDTAHIAVSCRSLFITTPTMTSANVTVAGGLPAWRPVAPWPAARPHEFSPRALEDLTDNMLAFSTTPPDVVAVDGFTMQIVAMGHWAPLRRLVVQTLRKIIALEAGMIGVAGPETYSVILAPTVDSGGQSYRQSLVSCFDRPSSANVAAWANTLAHEIFHYWNSARLVGQDYSSTQWFQEGFTEYVANLVLLVGEIATPAQFLARLAGHVANYRELTTTLENIGSHKGRPLYSAGALVAFTFDVMIRRSTAGRRTIATLFRNLWRGTNAGARKYAWPDVEAALQVTAPGAWGDYHANHIRGAERLPLAEAFALAGLRMRTGVDGAVSVEVDPEAPAAARAAWRSLNSRV